MLSANPKHYRSTVYPDLRLQQTQQSEEFTLRDTKLNFSKQTPVTSKTDKLDIIEGSIDCDYKCVQRDEQDKPSIRVVIKENLMRAYYANEFIRGQKIQEETDGLYRILMKLQRVDIDLNDLHRIF